MGKISYRCNDPNCTSIYPKSVLKGKKCLCSNCEENEFILTSVHLERAVPKCPICVSKSGPKVQKVLDKLGSILDNFVGDNK